MTLSPLKRSVTTRILQRACREVPPLHMTATWLAIFASWVVLAAVDLALAVALWAHPVAVLFVPIAALCGVFAGRALHKANVERRFRHVEDVAKRELLLMEKCAEHANRLGWEWHRDQLGAACEEMRRIVEK